MKQLKRDDILKYFEEINSQLRSRGEHGKILLLGGAAMTIAFDARDATYDIDAIFSPKGSIEQIISDMAKTHQLTSDWLNDVAKDYVTDKMKFNPFPSYSNLSISTIDAESLLAMKLTAARTYTEDMNDSVFLMNTLNIESETQLYNIVERYTDADKRNPAMGYFILEAYKAYQEKHKGVYHPKFLYDDNDIIHIPDPPDDTSECDWEYE